MDVNARAYFGAWSQSFRFRPHATLAKSDDSRKCGETLVYLLLERHSS